MEIQVKGKQALKGKIKVSSSKNAILPILAATLLADEEITINNVPNIRDVSVIIELLKSIGMKVERNEDSLNFCGGSSNEQPPYELVRQIRASFLVMGPLLATKGIVRLALPGGCAIGSRPIDLHLKGLEALGAKITLSRGDVVAKTNRLVGTHIYLDYPSVGATENIIMAAALAEGQTFIENAALEPEIADLANFINSIGGKIEGAGTNVIKVQGVKKLTGTTYNPVPDRIEAGTYMVASAASAGDVTISNVVPEHLKAISAKLIETGAIIEEDSNQIRVSRKNEIKPVYIKTLPYPGFPTDMQAQFMAYLSCARGSSVITESVFENRFMHVQELLRMGANIKTEGRTAVIKGGKELTGAKVRATDLRAGAALLIAALMARGTTLIGNSSHIDRGYENIVEKMNALGANIIRI
ncbi:MAG TPA: UDP-N-acetylglucosamine 1-carboxyvinyltransferase [Syntrophomonadaceae bacterium]|nr:UDP-N-acetylglucosamine 1-carboxyvinyltransferase [Syntrophomonadaceae bacterium]